MRLNLSGVASCLGLMQEGPDPLLAGVAIDSRKVRPGDLFVCLPGERVDGHAFARSAVERGAAAVLAARPVPDANAPVLVVEDPELALGRLAACWRSRFSGKVIVITGSCGKTTCKEAVAAILRAAGPTAATEGNLNNQLGLPLTILNSSGSEQYWVLEAGISKPGDMDYLGAIARPDLAVILNAGPAHEAGLGGKGTAWHKARLLAYLAPGGQGLINCDYPELAREAAAICGRLAFFSASSASADYYACAEPLPGRFRLRLGQYAFSADTPLRGEAGCENALAAAAAAHLAGVSDELIRAGLSGMKLPPRRGSQRQIGNFWLVDASYNANPLSMRAMLAEAQALANEQGRPLVCVLGAMLELGSRASAIHRELGRDLAAAAPAAVFWAGDWFDEIQGVQSGSAGANYSRAGTPAEVAAAIAANPLFSANGAVILVQGSRANRLDEYVDALEAALSGATDVL